MSSEREYRLEAARWLLAADQERNPGRRFIDQNRYRLARTSRADGNQ